MLFQVKKLANYQKLGGLLALIGAFSGFWRFYSTNQILYGLVSGFVIFSLTVQIVDKKRDWLDVLAFLLPFIFTGFQFTQIQYSVENINYIMPVQLVTLFALYLYYGNDIFTHIWSKNLFGIKDYWKNLPSYQVTKLTNLLPIVLIILILLHLFSAVNLFNQNTIFFVVHNLGIFIAVCMILFDFIIQKTGKLDRTTQLAKYYFHLGTILFIFDTMLEEIKYLNSGEVSWVSVFFNFVFLYCAFRPRG